jgi:hypothetical protein
VIHSRHADKPISARPRISSAFDNAGGASRSHQTAVASLRHLGRASSARHFPISPSEDEAAELRRITVTVYKIPPARPSSGTRRTRPQAARSAGQHSKRGCCEASSKLSP